MKVRVGDEEKGTAAAEGQEEPGWAEVLEFAISGEVASREDEEIIVRVWDHHWVSLTALWTALTSVNRCLCACRQVQGLQQLPCISQRKANRQPASLLWQTRHVRLLLLALVFTPKA